MANVIPGVKGLQDESDQSDAEYSPLFDDTEEFDQRATQEKKGWDLFQDIPVKKESGSMVSTAWIDLSLKILKLLAYIVIFCAVLGSAVIAKGTLFFITSQLKKDRQITHCNRALALDQQFITKHSLEERVVWLWAALIVFGVPEIGTFLRSVRICLFKTIQKPTPSQFLLAIVIETLHTVGVATLLLVVLPELDVVKGAMLMNAMCIVPGILNAFTRNPTDPRYRMKIIFDVIAVSSQITAFVVWPLLDGTPGLWSICLSSVFISLSYWENYIRYADNYSPLPLLYLHALRDGLKKSRYYTHSIVSIWKIVVFAICAMLSLHMQGDSGFALFTSMGDAFNVRNYTVHEVQVMFENLYDGTLDYVITGGTFDLTTSWMSPVWVALIQVGAAYFCYGSARVACKILIQNFSFTFALSLVGPVTINLLIVFCGIRNANPCAFHGTIPDYLFFEIPPVYYLREYVGREMAWVWLLWLVSQSWITLHAWKPRCERLATTDKLFAKPWYSGALIDQSLLMNRVDDFDVNDINTHKLLKKHIDVDNISISSENIATDVRPSDSISRVYICATMWHETKEEMIDFLKSIIRLDDDQCARRLAQKYFQIVDPDYYELEAHIFLDDAFELADHGKDEYQVNRFVKCLVETVDDAASEVHLTNMKLRPPKKYPTPYGGRLVWTLPGKNKMVCHLKNKLKVRHKKRWSQVMYMYYFLGHRLMDLPISVDRKEVIAENTYLLALDGDIDFKPCAVTLLIDLMKKNNKLGAACGRIHPVGAGFMAWYQMFEYAVGHWLQKATEHMIGCVLCSPGCFSLFRGKALMDNNVMKKYTLTSHEARHFVQYDQGEDRWLCTLLLQRGYRVEYSAASDAYTHCPESFNEFFNQRRRWVPSTTANILDLLLDSKRTVQLNDNISTLYIMYQIMLMLGTVLGPGTIFLMLIGAMNSITGMSNMQALMLNLIPVAIFLFVCMTCKSDTQLLIAGAITCFYAMLMMMVIVGIALQIVEDGWLAPSSIFTVTTFGIFFITAALHPQEIVCLLYLVVYYITIPSMYMLLIIYSVCNLNNVSWGTRETVQKKTAKEIENEQKKAEEAKKKVNDGYMSKIFGNSEETSGSLEFSIAGLFRCMCCTNPKDHKSDMHLMQIANSIEKMEKRLETLGASVEGDLPSMNRRRSTMAPRGMEPLSELPEFTGNEGSIDEPMEERDYLTNPSWIEDPDLMKGEVDFLTTAEIEFWNDMIDTYLRPIDLKDEEQERITRDLKNLRDKVVFAFVMLNALFVLVIFILQLNQDQLHFRWPLGQKMEIFYDDETNVVLITREYLMLEPIGSLFLIFFGLVMIIQFGAMLLHRLSTLTHLLSTTKLDWYLTKNPNELSSRGLIERNAVDLAKSLQKPVLAGHEAHDIMNNADVSRRKTLHYLERAKENKNAVVSLDANAKRRITILENGGDVDIHVPSIGDSNTARRATLRALKMRRDSVLAERRRSQAARDSTTVYLYNPANPNNEIQGRPSTASAYLNNAYVPAIIDSDEEDEDDAPSSNVHYRDT